MNITRCRLSIIIPAYNVEKYIGETLDSIVKWCDTRNDVEIIVIDDGSPDKSSNVVVEYQNKYPYISLIKQKNKGLGGARNTGISNAKGEYIWFVDSDDWVIAENLPIMIKILEEEKPQAVAICANDMELDNEIKQRFNFDGMPKYISGVEMLRSRRFSICAPFTIYSRKFLDDYTLRFQEHLFHEDIEFTPRAYFCLNHLRLFNRPLYLVRPNPNSITRSENYKKNFDLVKVAESLNNYKLKNVKEVKEKKIFDFFISLTLNTALKNCSSMPIDNYKLFLIEIDNHKDLFKSFWNSTKFKHRLQGILFTLIPLSPVYVYNGIMKKKSTSEK